ncbi:MAG: hypothetical protein QM718_11025 [Steroidobacteraceae bacterium]
MADKYYSVVKGEQIPAQVTEGSASSAEAIELRVSDSIYDDKLAVLLGVQALLAYLQTKETSPIA